MSTIVARFLLPRLHRRSRGGDVPWFAAIADLTAVGDHGLGGGPSFSQATHSVCGEILIPGRPLPARGSWGSLTVILLRRRVLRFVPLNITEVAKKSS